MFYSLSFLNSSSGYRIWGWSFKFIVIVLLYFDLHNFSQKSIIFIIILFFHKVCFLLCSFFFFILFFFLYTVFQQFDYDAFCCVCVLPYIYSLWNSWRFLNLEFTIVINLKKYISPYFCKHFYCSASLTMCTEIIFLLCS